MSENSKVPFTIENISKCICMECPVQTGSRCVEDKGEKAKEIMESDVMPKPEDIPGVYCSTGVGTCKDIETKQMCICGSCALWEEYKLAGGRPMGYFCRDGKAE